MVSKVVPQETLDYTDNLLKYKPDYVLIFPWNLSKEIQEQLQYIRDWGGKFVVFIPKIAIF